MYAGRLISAGEAFESGGSTNKAYWTFLGQKPCCGTAGKLDYGLNTPIS
jgi:hypothetical protein